MARLFRRLLSLHPCNALLAQLFRRILSLPLTADASQQSWHNSGAGASSCGALLTLNPSGAHARASSCGALVDRLFRVIVADPSQCSAGRAFLSDPVAVRHSRCFTAVVA